MREVGPLAETACEGWQVQDLAAHLWVREHKLAALPGIGMERFADKTRRIQNEHLHKLGFERILRELERPAGLMKVLDPIVNAAEYYIHHEDVLRPRGERAMLTDADQKSLLKVALMLARKAQVGKDFRLVVTPTNGHAKSFGRGDNVVYVEGAPNELLLHFSGRDSDVVIVADDIDAYKDQIKGL